MVAAQGVCERLHGDDRSGSGEQRSDGISRAGVEYGAAYVGRSSSASLILMLGGIAWLVRVYHIARHRSGQPGISKRALAADCGHDRARAFYYVAIASVFAVLAISANTAFADFPRLCRAIAVNGYLPDSFGLRGRRLVYSSGILVLSVLSAILLIIFGGVTDRLIPLVRHRRVSGVHHVAGWDGGALAAGERARSAAATWW